MTNCQHLLSSIRPVRVCFFCGKNLDAHPFRLMPCSDCTLYPCWENPRLIDGECPYQRRKEP